MERGPSNGRGPASWTARILAPVALIVVGLVVVLVVSGSLGGDEDDGKESRRERIGTSGCQPNDTGRQAVSNGYYVLQPGDDFASLAEDTCVSVEEIQRLNPDLDPQLLPQAGCVDLRPKGCKVLAEGG